MPNLREAAVAVTGQVMDIEHLLNFETKKPDGLRVVLATGDGFAQVKIALEDAKGMGVDHFQQVAWMVRFGAWSRNDQGQTTCRYVRDVTEDDLDKLASFSHVADTKVA